MEEIEMERGARKGGGAGDGGGGGPCECLERRVDVETEI